MGFGGNEDENLIKGQGVYGGIEGRNILIRFGNEKVSYEVGLLDRFRLERSSIDKGDKIDIIYMKENEKIFNIKKR